jgi:thiosulfate/3-mercaptopyruvate sulfurtransferase
VEHSVVDVVSVEAIREAVVERDGSYVVMDTRGAAERRPGHLPGAVDLSPETFSRLEDVSGIVPRLEAAGISRDTHLLLHDDGEGYEVGMMLWLLDRVGHPRVSVLDGGIPAWQAGGHPVETRAPEPQAGSYDASAGAPPYDNLATKEWILGNMDREDLTLVDTRSASEYTGSRISLRRTGRLPGAVWMEWSETLAQEPGKPPRFVAADEMARKLDALGITRDKELVCYCQVGVRSAQVYGVLRMLGFPRVKNYVGSWAEWGRDRRVPIEKG